MLGSRFRKYSFEDPESVIEELPYETVENGSLQFGTRTEKDGFEARIREIASISLPGEPLWRKIDGMLENRMNWTFQGGNVDWVYDKDKRAIYALTKDAIDDLEDQEYLERSYI